MAGSVPFLDLGGTTQAVRDSVFRSWSDLLNANRFVGGDAVEEFESRWADFCGTTFAVGVANGTDALHLTLRALGIGSEDEVVVPANSFVASAEAVVLAGATPRFADVDPTTLQLTPEQLEASITSRTRAALVVHLYGQMADMEALSTVADRHGIELIEDAAQAHGATLRGRRAGSFGRAGCFSFYPGKNLGGFGDAGAIVTSDRALALRLRSMRDHGRAEGSHYDHEYLGTNSRLDSLQAAVLPAKLACLPQWNDARRRTIGRYREVLAGTAIALVDEPWGTSGVFHLAVIRVDQRPRVRRMFDSLGIGTGVHYPIPLHRLGPYSHWATRELPVADRAAGEVLSLPMFPHMSEQQVSSVCSAIGAVNELLLAESVVHG